MEGIVNLLTLIFALLFLVILPIWMSLKLNGYLRKKGIDWRIRIASFLPLLIAIVVIYISFYPTDSHYKDIYKQVTKNEFPENAQFISKYSADPTFIEGWTLIIIKLNKTQYKNLKLQLKNLNYELETPSSTIDLKGGFEVNDFFKLHQDLQIDTVLSTKPGLYIYYGVAFLNDEETVIIKKII